MLCSHLIYKRGYFEVQDANSQLIAPYSLCEPKMNVIDACAGAGGKSLHLSTIMKNQGNIIAMDINPSKLIELKKRMIRNNIKIIKPTLIKCYFKQQSTFPNIKITLIYALNLYPILIQ